MPPIRHADSRDGAPIREEHPNAEGRNLGPQFDGNAPNGHDEPEAAAIQPNGLSPETHSARMPKR
jgi:hypothetical protein